MSAEKEEKITNSLKDEKEEHKDEKEEHKDEKEEHKGGKEEQKVKCTDCIHLVQSQHYLSQEVLGHHCFSIGRQQDYPDDYNFDALQVKKERACEWFESLADFKAKNAEHAGYSPKIQRFVTIRVRWGYDWKTEEED